MRTMLAAIVIAAAATVAQADFIADNQVPPILLSQLDDTPIPYEDKIFYNIEGVELDPFDLVDDSNIQIQVGHNEFGDIAIAFNFVDDQGAPSPLTVSEGQYFNVTVSYNVAVEPQAAIDGWRIKDIGWELLNVNAANGDSGVITGGERVYLQSANEPPIAQVQVHYAPANGVVQLRDDADFMLDGEPVHATEILVVKDLFVGFDDLTSSGDDQVVLGGFVQSFSQVPEPATLALLGAGGLLILRRRRA